MGRLGDPVHHGPLHRHHGVRGGAGGAPLPRHDLGLRPEDSGQGDRRPEVRAILAPLPIHPGTGLAPHPGTAEKYIYQTLSIWFRNPVQAALRSYSTQKAKTK